MSSPPSESEETTPNMAPAIINRRMIAWGPDGLPIPVSTPLISKVQIEALASTALSLPFHDPLCLEPEFEGMTNVEVMMVKMARKAAGGDLAVASELLDRVLGRPKQSMESKSLNLSYEDFLNEIARKNTERGGTIFDAA
jgi:hypothetical protein